MRDRRVERLRRLGFYRAASRLGPLSVKRLHYRVTTSPVNPQIAFSSELETYLRDQLRPDVQRLRSYMGSRLRRMGDR